METENSERTEAGLGPSDDPRERVAKHVNFFTFFEGARLVADGNFDGSVAGADELDEQLPIKVEAVALQGEAFYGVAAEDFIHRERVFQPDSEGNIDEQRERPMCGVEQKSVEGLVVELTHCEAVAGAVAGTEDERTFAGGEGREEFFVVVKIVFEIGVLDEDKIAGRAGERGADGVALAARFIFEQERDARVAAVSLDDGARAVGGIAFDENEFDLPAGDEFGDDGVQRGTDRRGLIENGYDDRER